MEISIIYSILDGNSVVERKKVVMGMFVWGWSS